MKETIRISNLFGKLYHGPAWIDVNIVSVLERVSGKQAATKLLPNCNSIWEITNHLIGWRENILQRIQGKVAPSPPDNYFKPITDSSDEAWAATRSRLEQSQRNWLELLTKFNPDHLDTSSKPGGGFTNYELAHGILQHDAYHLGQLVLLAKQIQ